MRAFVLHGVSDLRLEDVNMPELQDNEVVVQVKAVGICGSDIPRIYQTGTYHFPTIPGHEFSGVVVETGKVVDTLWKGKRVGIFPLVPCQECKQCKMMQYEMCKNYRYLGSRTNGGFAEYVAVPVWNLIELPENVSYEAAAMLEPMAVAVHAMRSIEVKYNEVVAICGLGTIGVLLTKFLIDAGIHNLYVIGNKDFQKHIMMQMGVSPENYLDSRQKNISDWIMKRTRKEGVNVFFDCIGKNEIISAGMNSVSSGGRVQLIGNPVSDIQFDKGTYWKILRNQLTIKGSWNSSFYHDMNDDWHYVMGRLEKGSIIPEQYITQSFGFEELERGLQIMKDKTQEYIKVMIMNGEVKKFPKKGLSVNTDF